ncbi:MAG: hypothetical protein WCB92_10935 [Mycobacterium sp.]
MTSTDVALDFWLRYVEASGGLTEFGGDTTLVMLPPALQTMLELPEVLQVTADPDVAREDGATFLSAGHPALGRTADEVLAVGDVAAMAVPVAAAPPPPAEHLQAMARDQFTVDHGRIDATGAPTRSVRAILRVGALVDYTLSSDDHYQECAECWVDVQSQRQLPTHVSMKLAALPTVPKDGSPSLAGLTGLTGAIGFADRVIQKCAERRRSELGDDIDKARDAELERVEVYYRDALATIERRRAQAPADRRELLDARADSVRNERARRIGETREKYQASHEVRPYRLHIYEVPVWRLPVDVRRGDRRYPLTLDWLIPLTRFTDIACPHCGADERLVATKTRLGCASCVPPRIARLVPEPTRPPADPKFEPAAKAKQVVTQPPTPRQHPSPVRTDPSAHPSPLPAKLPKLGDKLIGKVWDAVVHSDRRLARICAPDSPAAAAIRLYGPSGAAWAVGISPTDEPVAFAARTTTASTGLRHASSGCVDTAAGRRFPFLLRWQAPGGTGQIDEILPYDRPFEPAHLRRWAHGPGLKAVHAPPQPRIPLGPVGELLWRRVIPTFGLPGVLRCLAALWRLPDEDVFLNSHGPAAVAAGIERMVCQRANLTTGRFADIAAAYRVKEATVRAADADLQKCLRLGPERWW